MKASNVLRGAGQAALATLVTAPLVALVAGGWMFAGFTLAWGLILLGVVHLAIRLAGRAETRRVVARQRSVPFYTGTDPRYDRPATRHDAFAIGLPWMERDGTLTWPPPTPEQTHAELHARRMAAEEEK